MLNGMAAGNGERLKKDGTATNIGDLLEHALGAKGAVVVKDTTKTDAAAGTHFCAIQCLSETVISAYASVGSEFGAGLATLTLAAGTIIYGRFTSVTLTSGNVILYKGVTI